MMNLVNTRIASNLSAKEIATIHDGLSIIAVMVRARRDAIEAERVDGRLYDPALIDEGFHLIGVAEGADELAAALGRLIGHHVAQMDTETPPPETTGNGRISITVRYGSERHSDEIGLEKARRWAAYRMAENGEIDLPEDDSDPDASGIDDATVVAMIADDIGSNLDYEKLR